MSSGGSKGNKSTKSAKSAQHVVDPKAEKVSDNKKGGATKSGSEKGSSSSGKPSSKGSDTKHKSSSEKGGTTTDAKAEKGADDSSAHKGSSTVKSESAKGEESSKADKHDSKATKGMSTSLDISSDEFSLLCIYLTLYVSSSESSHLSSIQYLRRVKFQKQRTLHQAPNQVKKAPLLQKESHQSHLHMIQKLTKNQTRRVLTRQLLLEREVRRILMIKPHLVRWRRKSLLSHLLPSMPRQRRKALARLINLLLAREMPRHHFSQNRRRQRVKSLVAASRIASPPKHLPVKRPRL